MSAVDTQCNATSLAYRATALLERFAYRFSSEVELHEGIAAVLDSAGIGFKREFVAGPQDRFDFLLGGGVVIEVKVQGSLPEALRQVDRYAARDDVAAVVLATTRFWGRSAAPASLHGKPFYIAQLRRKAF